MPKEDGSFQPVEVFAAVKEEIISVLAAFTVVESVAEVQVEEGGKHADLAKSSIITTTIARELLGAVLSTIAVIDPSDSFEDMIDRARIKSIPLMKLVVDNDNPELKEWEEELRGQSTRVPWTPITFDDPPGYR